jgi:DNA-binding phage protein
LADGGNPEWNTIKKIVDHLGYEVKVVKKENWTHQRKDVLGMM